MCVTVVFVLNDNGADLVGLDFMNDGIRFTITGISSSNGDPTITYIDPLKPLKNVYGTKQGSRRFYDHTDKVLTSIGFTQCPVEPCLYRFVDDDGEAFFLLYVDDALISGSCIVLMSIFIPGKIFSLKAVLRRYMIWPVRRFQIL